MSKPRVTEVRPGEKVVQIAEPWPEPGVIAPSPDPQEYPLKHLPEVARSAVSEYQAYGGQPTAMVASAAIAQMALAAQGLADVARDSVLRSPCSLNVLIVGESGERKTAVEAALSAGAREWEREAREARLPEHRRAKAMQHAVAERKLAVTKKIGGLEAKGGAQAEADLRALEQRLMELTDQEAELPIQPLAELFYEETTLEALHYALATGHPSAMLASDEAGLVFGGRGMADESALGMLTFLNRMWDGREFRPKRKQAKVADIRGRRFSSSLMLQSDLLRTILSKGARGVGWFGRYLLAAPRSTMGSRFYIPPANDLPGLRSFHKRARDLLELDLPLNERGELEPPMMMLDRAALAVWREYYDAVERELGEYGELSLVRDVGAKSAENAARIACVCQIWADGPGGTIQAHHMESGVALASWHLLEANRIFWDADKPPDVRDAELLSEWLLGEGRTLLDEKGCMPIREILHCGPNRLRDRQRRDEALQILADEETAHLRLQKEGKRRLLQINPKLLGAAS